MTMTRTSQYSHKGSHKRRGTVAVLVAVCLIALMGVTAIALDGGTLVNERRHGQVTADAAALAAAGDLYKNWFTNLGKDPLGSAKQAALDVAKNNGYDNDNKTNTVTVNIPPTSGNFSGKDGYVEVILQYNQKRAFSGIFSSGDIPVRARAVARGVTASYRRGLILLNPSKTDAFQVSGNGTIDVVGGSILVNSNAAIAAHFSGNGTIAAESTEIVGNYQNSGPATITGPIHTQVDPTPDPLASLPEPKLSDYTVQAGQLTSISSDDPVVLQPGVYRGGINISGNGSVTMLPGVYIMEGGGFQVSGNGILTGKEVMIYNMVGPGGNHGQVLISGNGKINLTPPSTGTYQGMGIFQQRTQTDRLQISGNGNTYIGGVVYAKAADTQVSGNGLVGVDTLGGSYVCDTMQVSGNGSVDVDLGGNLPPAIRYYGLVE